MRTNDIFEKVAKQHGVSRDEVYSEIQKASLKLLQKNGETVCELSADCVQDIGELQEIYIEKNGDNT